ncbi:MAG: hypothetical protein RIE53_12815 [Rhodothermales bacterium]
MRYLLLLVAFGWLGQTNAWAQLSYGGGRSASQAAGVGVAFVSFEYTGSSAQEANFSFTNPAYGVVLSRPGFLAGFHRGTQDSPGGEELTFTEFGLLAYGSFRPFSSGRGGSPRSLEPLVPLGVQTSYRRVSRDLDTGTFNAFEFTVAAIGAGLGVQRETRSSLFVVRAMPMFGIAARSFGGDTGTSRILDVDAELQLGPWSDGFGLMVGWGFRWQDWNLSSSRLLTDATQDTFDYAGIVHSIRLGLIF